MKNARQTAEQRDDQIGHTEDVSNHTGNLAKDYVRASGMMLRVGKAVLGLLLVSLTKMVRCWFTR